MTGFRSKSRGDKIGNLTEGRTDTADQTSFCKSLPDVGNRTHDLLHSTQGIRRLSVTHLVEHIGKLASCLGCSPADRADCPGHLFGSFRTFEFGKAFLECLENAFPLVIAAFV